MPGELFVIEIGENEPGWSGHLRIGLTQINPKTIENLPLYALPDLVALGPSWLHALTQSHDVHGSRNGSHSHGMNGTSVLKSEFEYGRKSSIQFHS